MQFFLKSKINIIAFLLVLSVSFGDASGMQDVGELKGVDFELFGAIMTGQKPFDPSCLEGRDVNRFCYSGYEEKAKLNAKILFPLLAACSGQNENIVDALLRKGADPDRCLSIEGFPNNGMSSLDYLVNGMSSLDYLVYLYVTTKKPAYKDMFDFLLKNGADINSSKNVYRLTPLQKLLKQKKDCPEGVKMLLDAKADVNVPLVGNEPLSVTVSGDMPFTFH